MNETPTVRNDWSIAPALRRRVSWGAIWAGMFVTVIIQVMLTLLGIACGIATLNPVANPPSAPAGLSTGAAIWLMVSWLISIWAGARVGGWMCGGPRRVDGTVHGIVVWSFSAAVILLLASGVAGTVIGSNGGATLVPGSSTQPSSSAMAPTGRSGNQPYQYQNNNSYGSQGQNQAQGSNSQNANSGNAGTNVHGIWGDSLWTFIALILGLAVAAWGGSTGVSSSERTIGTVVTAV